MIKKLIVMAMLFLAGCGKISEQIQNSVSRAKPAGFPPAPSVLTPQPVSEPDYQLKGEAFLKLNRGSDELGGMKVQLVDADRFSQAFETLKKTLLARFISFQVRMISDRLNDNTTKQRQWEAVEKIKTAEYKQAVKDHWVSLVYQDPLTGQRYQVTSLDVLKNRLGDVHDLINSIKTQNGNDASQIAQWCQSVRENCPDYTKDTDSVFLARVPTILSEIDTEEDLVFRSTSDIIAALDQNTEDQVVINHEGHFVFPHVKRKALICYAQHISDYGKTHEVLCWMVKVQWDPEGPREVVLASQNSLGFEDWLKNARPASMATAMQDWLKGFK